MRHRTSGLHRTSEDCRVNSVDCSVLGCAFRTSVRDRTSGESDIRCRTDNRQLVYAIWRVPFGTPMGTGHPTRRTSGVDRTSGIFASPLMFSCNSLGNPVGTGHPMRRTSGAARTSGILRRPSVSYRYPLGIPVGTGHPVHPTSGGHWTSGGSSDLLFCQYP